MRNGSKKERDNTMINLGYENYKKELKQRLEESKEFDAISEYNNDLTFNSPTYEIPMMDQDSIFGEKT